MCETRRRRWRIVGIFKTSKIILTVSFAYDTSFKSLGKGLEHLIDKFKSPEGCFGVHTIREF